MLPVGLCVWKTPDFYSYVYPQKPGRKIVNEHLGGGVGGSIGSPFYFPIHPIAMKFGTYNKLHLYSQLNENT